MKGALQVQQFHLAFKSDVELREQAPRPSKKQLIWVTPEKEGALVRRLALGATLVVFIGCNTAKRGPDLKDSNLSRSDVKLTVSLIHNDSVTGDGMSS